MSTFPAPADSTQGDAILFRPSKKRKIYRQRLAQDEPDPSPTAPSISSPDADPVQSLDELISTASASLPSHDEEVSVSMSEILLEIYEEPRPEPHSINDFRRDFLDAVSQKQRKKSAPSQQTARGPGGKKEEELMKGPKLGGTV
ncbi:hypothetical protein BUE80_DR006726 [Diplocarpon rosae]|nr:hypothetical protein BUE80_DR006726 [Diplocarpon rosae]